MPRCYKSHLTTTVMYRYYYLLQYMHENQSVFRIRICMDPHKDMPPHASAWTDADPDPDPGGKKAYKMFSFIR